MKNKIENYNQFLGQKFGPMTVKEIIHHPNGIDVSFKIFCELCKKESLKPPSRLLTKHISKSCGCKQYIGFEKHNEKIRDDFTGKKIGHLLVLRKDPTHKPRHIKWICKCDCGVEKSILAVYLKHHIAKSCGCQQFKQREKHGSWRGHGEISGHEWNRIKKCALRRNIPFEITIEQAWEQFLKQNRKCAYSGLDLFFYRNSKLTPQIIKTTASIDRIDCNKGYVVENIVWCHKNINIMKNALNLNEFIHYCYLVYKNQNFNLKQEQLFNQNKPINEQQFVFYKNNNIEDYSI